jgi:surface antigen
MAGGCSFPAPMFVSQVETPAARPIVETTGSVAPVRPAVSGPALSDHLGQEDIRRASGAMALALDPQGNGAPVSWDNAESKASGRFTPVALPFLKDDEICRAFLATVRTAMEEKSLQGTACRLSGGDWTIKDLKPWRQPA